MNLTNQEAIALKNGKYGHTAHYNTEWNELADFFTNRANFIKDAQSFVQKAKVLLAEDKKEEVLELLNSFIAKY